MIVCPQRIESQQLSAAVLPFPVGDPPFGEVIWRQFYPNLVTGDDSDEVFTHPAGHVGHYFGTGFKLNSKSRVCQSLGYGSLNLERFFFATQNETSVSKLVFSLVCYPPI